jgi:hypothetical protein
MFYAITVLHSSRHSLNEQECFMGISLISDISETRSNWSDIFSENVCIVDIPERSCDKITRPNIKD